MIRLMNMLMLSCRKATELMEKKLHANLALTERLQLFLHTRMCDACRIYEKQSHFMDSVLKKKSAIPGSTEPEQKILSEDVKYRIIEELDKL
jgi:hypothetical protein